MLRASGVAVGHTEPGRSVRGPSGVALRLQPSPLHHPVERIDARGAEWLQQVRRVVPERGRGLEVDLDHPDRRRIRNRERGTLDYRELRALHVELDQYRSA